MVVGPACFIDGGLLSAYYLWVEKKPPVIEW